LYGTYVLNLIVLNNQLPVIHSSMKTRIKFKHLLALTLAVSILCSIYLHVEFIEYNEQGQEIVGIVSSAGSHDNFIFPEVEVVKVFIEKIIDIVTISRV